MLKLVLNTKKISKETSKLLKQGVGYRTEDFVGSGVRDIERVLQFELLELRNKDIFYTLRNLYSVNINLRNSQEYLAKIHKDIIYTALESRALYCIWLASKNVVQNYYQGINIQAYRIPLRGILRSEVLVLSDLGVFSSNQNF